jgi:hypothetical protein
MATAAASAEPVSPWRLKLPDRLPELSGWFLRTYRLLWVVTAVLALASSTFFAFRYEVRDQAVNLAMYHAGLREAGEDIKGSHVAAFSREARAAGIGPDEVLVRIDGRPAPLYENLPPVLDGPDGTRVAVTLAAPDGNIHQATLTRSRSYLADAYARTGINWTVRRWFEFSMRRATDLLGLIVAALLFVRRPRDPVAAFISFGVLLAVMNLYQLGGHSLGGLATLKAALADAFVMIGILFFPDGRLAPRWWPLAVSTIAALPPAEVALYLTSAPQWAGALFWLVPLVLSAAAVFSRYTQTPSGRTRQQIKFAVLGFVLSPIFAVLGIGFGEAIAVASSEGVRAWLIVFGSVAGFLSTAALLGGLLISLLRYRLYDADSVIGRSAAYGVLTLGFVALFAGTEKLAEIVGETYFEHSIGMAAGAAGAAVAAAVVVPLHNRVHRWAERRFQKALIRLRDGLPECLADLRESAPLGEIIRAVLNRVDAGVHSTSEALVVAAARKWSVAGAHAVTKAQVRQWTRGWAPPMNGTTLDCDRRDSIFPLRIRLCIESADHAETIGWLLLGPRPDGSFFGKDEREVLESIAGPIARAIHIAQLREQRDARAEERLSALERLIANLLAGTGQSAAPA